MSYLYSRGVLPRWLLLNADAVGIDSRSIGPVRMAEDDDRSQTGFNLKSFLQNALQSTERPSGDDARTQFEVGDGLAGLDLRAWRAKARSDG
jgi:hypothetical protein